VLPLLLTTAGEGVATGYVVASAVFAGLALFAVGASLSLFTGRSALVSGLRQLGLGAAAATLTYVIGSVIGVSTTA